jgi:hypothetical protein
MKWFDCDEVGEFIGTLYKFLRNQNICFLSGSFVFEDPNGVIDESLREGRGRTECDNIYKKIRPTGKFATHKGFLHDVTFRERTESGDFALKPMLPMRMYEKVLKNVDVACDSKEIVTKGVMLFYPFAVEGREDNTLPTHRFLFAKLERYVHDDIHHAVAAIERYILRQEKKDEYPKRREDPKSKIKWLVAQDTRKMISYVFHRKGSEVANRVMKKIEFFDKHVRIGNEVYFPEEVLDILFGPIFKTYF